MTYWTLQCVYVAAAASTAKLTPTLPAVRQRYGMPATTPSARSSESFRCHTWWWSSWGRCMTSAGLPGAGEAGGVPLEGPEKLQGQLLQLLGVEVTHDADLQVGGVHEGHDSLPGLWQLQGLDLRRLQALEAPGRQDFTFRAEHEGAG